ncbi:DUF3159 domain-containing protein [Canibacter zhoujuaniae]|uniref:DUF3159 domain-containing protein n=1 Tax=Canibacter zhoujuaniae TaxID=2708343 RepID=UPI00142492D3|nr:DUF3159 domain-containing protein [Canibacter zhoujuaniae]
MAFLGKNAGGGMVTAVRRAARGEEATANSVVTSMGGVRGLIESAAPGIIFLIIFTLTQKAVWAALISLALSFALVLVRAFRRENPLPALYGAAAVGICTLLVLFTGKGTTYYVPGFWINTLWAIVIIVSLAVRWPLLGIITGALTGSLTAWRDSKPLRRTAWVFTFAWLGLFIARLAVQLPLYFAGHVEALGLSRIVMGLPLYGLLLFLTWRGFAAAFAVEKQRSKKLIIE